MNQSLRTGEYRSLARKGFTLVEILVVISIIFILTSVVYASINEARKSARDKARIADLETIKASLHIYAATNLTYAVTGTGYDNSGTGMFAFQGDHYQKSIAQGLVEAQIIPSVITDPLVPNGYSTGYTSSSHYGYMVYFVNDDPQEGVCVFAQLERPNADHEEAFDNAQVPASTKNMISSGARMNYATCI